jgi:LysM repeat protein
MLMVLMVCGFHAAPAAAATYTVETGDTLSKIAQPCGCDWRDICNLNRLADCNKIYPGQVLNLPPACAGCSKFEGSPT